MRRGMAVAAALTALLALAGCSDGSDASADSEASSTPAPSTPPTASPAPAPVAGSCYRLDYADAVALTTQTTSSPCRRTHTAETYAVGTVDDVVAGHLLSVESDRVQASVAQTCPARLGDFVGGTETQQRLSMLKSVWFTPSVDASAEGADWYRCDVVALAGNEQLAGVKGSLKGVLTTTKGRDDYAMCGTAKPGTDGFEHVSCSADHSWKAIGVVDFPDGKYPGVKAAKAKGQQPCNDAGRDAASDPLNYQWAYEFPTKQQWDAGQTFGRCWAPA